MIRLKIRDSYFQVIDGYRVNESSREVKFSSLVVDFTNKTIADLPLKYQEVQLLDLDNEYNVNEVIYTGYVNNFTLPKMKNRNEYRELELDLLSPLAMATVRTVDAVGTYELQSLVRELIQPLIDDGFVLKEMNIGNNQITVNFLSETVESSLNKLSNKFNFWWYIDANKNIYINSITYLMSLNPKLTYDDSNPIKGLIDVIPSIDATDYCNVVNFTNVRMYTDSFLIWDYYSEDYDNKIMTGFYPLFEKSVLNNGDEIEFNYPVDISSKATVTMANYSNGFHIDNTPLAIFEDSQDHGTYPRLRLYLDENNNVVIPNDATISDSYSDENTWVLVRDSFFNNLIVGLKYNGESFNIKVVSSLTALIWAKVKVQDNIEINKNKSLISQTGIVEKQIDMNETWKTYNELIEIANSYIKKNSSKVDTVKLNVDYDVNLNIGDTMKINKDYFLIDDVYIITDKTSTYEGNVKSWSYTLKNTNILENYVDLFRASENQDDEQKKINLITSDYIEEGFQERYEVVVNES